MTMLNADVGDNVCVMTMLNADVGEDRGSEGRRVAGIRLEMLGIMKS